MSAKAEVKRKGEKPNVLVFDVKIAPHSVQGGKYVYGRIQITLDPEYIGKKAKVIVILD